MNPRLALHEGDITRLDVDAIVNAANPTLLGGGGVDGAIHRAAGIGLRLECALLGGCTVGQAKRTGGHRLTARHIFHTVGPYWRGGTHGEAELLASCYRRCFALASAHAVRTMAFPAISCGVYGYPAAEACRIAVRESRRALDALPGLAQVLLVAFDEAIAEAYRAALVEGAA